VSGALVRKNIRVIAETDVAANASASTSSSVIAMFKSLNGSPELSFKDGSADVNNDEIGGSMRVEKE